ncbi:MAG: hypothetical protein ACOYOB_07050 [Myxococcota bacterium]
MGSEVVDTNVLMVATAMEQGWSRPRVPVDDLVVMQRVFRWVKAFREDPSRLLVMDAPRRTILEEYNKPKNLSQRDYYGRKVVQHKFDTGAIQFVDLQYWANGTEWVAVLPADVAALFHDLGDRKMVAAAFNADAPIINATDGDWTEAGPAQGLQTLGVVVTQLLTPLELAACKGGRGER